MDLDAELDAMLGGLGVDLSTVAPPAAAPSTRTHTHTHSHTSATAASATSSMNAPRPSWTIVDADADADAMEGEVGKRSRKQTSRFSPGRPAPVRKRAREEGRGHSTSPQAEDVAMIMRQREQEMRMKIAELETMVRAGALTQAAFDVMRERVLAGADDSGDAGETGGGDEDDEIVIDALASPPRDAPKVTAAAPVSAMTDMGALACAANTPAEFIRMFYPHRADSASEATPAKSGSPSVPAASPSPSVPSQRADDLFMHAVSCLAAFAEAAATPCYTLADRASREHLRRESEVATARCILAVGGSMDRDHCAPIDIDNCLRNQPSATGSSGTPSRSSSVARTVRGAMRSPERPLRTNGTHHEVELSQSSLDAGTQIDLWEAFPVAFNRVYAPSLGAPVDVWDMLGTSAGALAAVPAIGCGQTYGLRCKAFAHLTKPDHAAADGSSEPIGIGAVFAVFCDGLGFQIPHTMRAAISEDDKTEWASFNRSHSEALKRLRSRAAGDHGADVLVCVLHAVAALLQISIGKHAITHDPELHGADGVIGVHYAHPSDSLKILAMLALLASCDPLTHGAVQKDTRVRRACERAASSTEAVWRSPESAALNTHASLDGNDAAAVGRRSPYATDVSACLLVHPAAALRSTVGLVLTIADVLSWRDVLSEILGDDDDGQLAPSGAGDVAADTPLIPPAWVHAICELLQESLSTVSMATAGVWHTMTCILADSCRAQRVFSRPLSRPVLAPGPAASMYRLWSHTGFSAMLRACGAARTIEDTGLRLSDVVDACAKIKLRALLRTSTPSALSALPLLMRFLRHIVVAIHALKFAHVESEQAGLTLMFARPNDAAQIAVAPPRRPFVAALTRLSRVVGDWHEVCSGRGSPHNDIDEFSELCRELCGTLALYSGNMEV